MAAKEAEEAARGAPAGAVAERAVAATPVMLVRAVRVAAPAQRLLSGRRLAHKRKGYAHTMG